MENNVLFVDDELHILKAIKRGLHKETYNKFYASSGQEALEILEAQDIHVIVCDMKMPEMNGLELLTIVNEKYPLTVKIILSGYTQLQQIIVTINRINIYKFLTKPWDMETEFKVVLDSAIDFYNTQVENINLKKSLLKKNELYQNMIRSNSDKLSLMRSDFLFLEDLNKVLVNFYYKMGLRLKSGAISDDVYRIELGEISHFYSQVIAMMPTKHDEFNIGMLQEQLSKFLVNHKKDGNVASRINIASTNGGGIYCGNHSILVFTLTSMLDHYFALDDGDAYVMALTVEDKIDDEGAIVEFNIVLKSESNEVLTDKLRLYTVMTFFTNLIKSYNGVLSIETRNEENLVLMRFPFRLKGLA